MATLTVSYPLTPGARFDADYYVATHLPLVREKWAAFGLTEAAALLPDQNEPPFAALALLHFETRDGIERALISPEADAVFGDLVNFTDIKPVPMLAKQG